MQKQKTPIQKVLNFMLKPIKDKENETINYYIRVRRVPKARR